MIIIHTSAARGQRRQIWQVIIIYYLLHPYIYILYYISSSMYIFTVKFKPSVTNRNLPIHEVRIEESSTVLNMFELSTTNCRCGRNLCIHMTSLGRARRQKP